jgi:excinuclease ABC subunit C
MRARGRTSSRHRQIPPGLGSAQGECSLKTHLEELRQKARLAPEGPGVYIHFGEGRKVLYVGKAKNLRNRLKTYFFGGSRLPHRTQQLVARVVDFDVLLVQNENESLIAESQFIKSHRPPFNVLLRDDKAYPYVRIDRQEEWPRVRMVRRRKEDGALYFGPFASSGQMAHLLSVIRRHFPLVKCTPHVFKTIPRPCNYFSMKQCLAPCHLPVEPKEYSLHVDAVVSLMKGRRDGLRQELVELMGAASENLDFERAATYRDQIKAIDELSLGQSVDLGFDVQADLIGVFWGHDHFSLQFSGVRSGRLVSSYGVTARYALEVPDWDESIASDFRSALRVQSLSEIVRQYYLENSPPVALVIIDPDKTALAALLSVLEPFFAGLGLDQAALPTLFLSPDSWIEDLRRRRGGSARVERSDLVQLCGAVVENARQRYQDDQQVSDQAELMLLGLQTFLDLPTPPTWIECFDISTFQGRETVASQVVFLEGRAARRQYRKYIVSSVEGQDDFASLREVMRRRFRDSTGSDLPHVVLIDGGSPQVREVRKVLCGMGLHDLKVVGIAKARSQKSRFRFAGRHVIQSQERLVIPRGSGADGEAEVFETRELRIGSPEFRLVTQLRDEAHRFAISFHRARRNKQSMRSSFAGIPGLGPKRMAQLTAVYRTPAEVAGQEASEVSKRTGLPLALAVQILETVRERLGGS